MPFETAVDLTESLTFGLSRQGATSPHQAGQRRTTVGQPSWTASHAALAFGREPRAASVSGCRSVYGVERGQAKGRDVVRSSHGAAAQSSASCERREVR